MTPLLGPEGPIVQGVSLRYAEPYNPKTLHQLGTACLFCVDGVLPVLGKVSSKHVTATLFKRCAVSLLCLNPAHPLSRWPSSGRILLSSVWMDWCRVSCRCLLLVIEILCRLLHVMEILCSPGPLPYLRTCGHFGPLCGRMY